MFLACLIVVGFPDKAVRFIMQLFCAKQLVKIRALKNTPATITGTDFNLCLIYGQVFLSPVA